MEQCAKPVQGEQDIVLKKSTAGWKAKEIIFIGGKRDILATSSLPLATDSVSNTFSVQMCLFFWFFKTLCDTLNIIDNKNYTQQKWVIKGSCWMENG